MVSNRDIMRKIATIGFFDGVHKGHQFLFEQLRLLASERGLEPLIVTFDCHPRAVLQADYMPQLLTTLPERQALLNAYGNVLVLSFESIHALTAEQFMHYLHSEQGVDVLVMGYDHRFGSDRLRRLQDYQITGRKIGVEVLNLGEFVDGEWHVSSTEIRMALENGNVVVANELLGYPYALSGIVVHGNGIGRQIGFPTANIQPDSKEKIVPKAGVYVVTVSGEGVQTQGILNIGTNPTVGNNKQTIELHIPDFSGDLYNQRLTISFERYLREERRFENLLELQKQIEQDILHSGRRTWRRS